MSHTSPAKFVSHGEFSFNPSHWKLPGVVINQFAIHLYKFVGENDMEFHLFHPPISVVNEAYVTSTSVPGPLDSPGWSSSLPACGTPASLCGARGHRRLGRRPRRADRAGAWATGSLRTDLELANAQASPSPVVTEKLLDEDGGFTTFKGPFGFAGTAFPSWFHAD